MRVPVVCPASTLTGPSEAEAVTAAARQILAAERQPQAQPLVGPPPLPPGAQSPGLWQRVEESGSVLPGPAAGAPAASVARPPGGVLWERGDTDTGSQSHIAGGSLGGGVAGGNGVLWVRQGGEQPSEPGLSEQARRGVGASAGPAAPGAVEEGVVAGGAAVVWRRTEEPVEALDGTAATRMVWRRDDQPSTGTSLASKVEPEAAGMPAAVVGVPGAEGVTAASERSTSSRDAWPGSETTKVGDGAGILRGRRSPRAKDPALYDNVEYSMAPFGDGDGFNRTLK